MSKERLKELQMKWVDSHPIPNKDAQTNSPVSKASSSLKKKRKKASKTHREEEVDLEIDLHNFAIDEAMAEIELAIESMKSGGLTRLRVIHGRASFRQGTIFFQFSQNIKSIWKKNIERTYREKHNPGASILELKGK